MRAVIFRLVYAPIVILAGKIAVILQVTILDEVSCGLRRILGSKVHIIYVLSFCRAGECTNTDIGKLIIVSRIGPLEISRSLIGRRERDVLFGKTRQTQVTDGLRRSVGGNRRSRRFDGHDARCLTVGSAIQELGIEGVAGNRGGSEAFEFECLRDLDGCVRNNHRVHTFTPNHQVTGVLLVIKSHDAVDGTGLVCDIRFRSHAHKRCYLTSTFGSIGTVPIEAYTNQTTCRRLACLEEIIGVGIGCSEGYIEVLQSLARAKLITIQASP